MTSDLNSKKMWFSTKIELKTWKTEYYKVFLPVSQESPFFPYFLKYLNIKPFNALCICKLIFTSILACTLTGKCKAVLSRNKVFLVHFLIEITSIIIVSPSFTDLITHNISFYETLNPTSNT